MPELVERRSTDALIGTRSVLGAEVQPISTDPTPPVSLEGNPWNTAITMIVPGPDSETVIRVSDATIVYSAAAIATAGAITKSFTFSNPLPPLGSLAPQRRMANFIYLTSHVPEPSWLQRTGFTKPEWREEFAVLYNAVHESDYLTAHSPTHLPFGDVAVFGSQIWDDDILHIGFVPRDPWQLGRSRRYAQDTNISQPYVIYSSTGIADERITQIFNNLAAEWKAERSEVHSGAEIFLLPAYQKIIGLGTGAVTLILRELQRGLDHWFWALAAITREDPVPAEFKGNMPAMREYWLSWGRRQGYRW